MGMWPGEATKPARQVMWRLWCLEEPPSKRLLSKSTGDNNMNTKAIFSRRTLLAAATLAVCVSGQAQTPAAWPNKPVRFIVHYTPGGSNDVVARIIGQKLSEYWGQPVLVENKPGVGGNIGAAFVAKSPADGYTLLITPNNLTTMNPYLYSKEKLGYEVAKDFEPISMLAKGPILLAVNAKLPVN
jgi:tripartite-type tricarboxylate transporter receptor subunit TctC